MEIGLVAEEVEIDSSGVIFPENGFDIHQIQDACINHLPREAEHIIVVNTSSSMEMETIDQSKSAVEPSSSCITYSVNLNTSNVFEVSSKDILKEIFRISRNKLEDEGSCLLNKKYFSTLRVLYSVYKEFISMAGEDVSVLEDLRGSTPKKRKSRRKKKKTITHSRARALALGYVHEIEPIDGISSDEDETVPSTSQNGRWKNKLRKSCKKLPNDMLEAIEEQEDEQDSDFSNSQTDDSDSSSSSISSSNDSDSSSDPPKKVIKNSNKKNKTSRKRSNSSSDSEEWSNKRKRGSSKRLVKSNKKLSTKNGTKRKISNKERKNMRLRKAGEFIPETSFTEVIHQIIPTSSKIYKRKGGVSKSSTKQKNIKKTVQICLQKLEKEEDQDLSIGKKSRTSTRGRSNQISSDDDEEKRSTRSQSNKNSADDDEKKRSTRSRSNKISSDDDEEKRSTRSQSNKNSADDDEQKRSTRSQSNETSSVDDEKQESTKSRSNKISVDDDEEKRSTRSQSNKISADDDEKKRSTRSRSNKISADDD